MSTRFQEKSLPNWPRHSGDVMYVFEYEAAAGAV
jgi:hypothetical protein